MLKKIAQKARKLINYFKREKQFEKLLYQEGWRKTSEMEFEFRGYYRFEKGDFILTHNMDKNIELFFQYEKIAQYKQYLTKRDIGQIFYKTNTLKIKSQNEILIQILNVLDKGSPIFPKDDIHIMIKSSL